MPSVSTRILRFKIRCFWPLALIEKALAAIIFDEFVAIHDQLILRQLAL